MENHPPSPQAWYVHSFFLFAFGFNICFLFFVPKDHSRLSLRGLVTFPLYFETHRHIDLSLTQTVSRASSSTNLPTESSFSFTPIKALSALPRLWDRKPSTPVRAGDKTRKLWKRIRFPFTGMNTATEGQTSGVGSSKHSDYQRGVKRQCVGPAEAYPETDAEQRGRSFLETKWEMQGSRKRRKFLSILCEQCTHRPSRPMYCI